MDIHNLRLSIFLVNKPRMEKVAVSDRILLAFVTKEMSGMEDLRFLLQTSNCSISILNAYRF